MAHISSTSWIDRRSAIEALFVITESCYEAMIPSLDSICSTVRPLLFDSSPAVSKKCAYFFSEASDYVGSILFDAAPWLLNDIESVSIDLFD